MQIQQIGNSPRFGHHAAAVEAFINADDKTLRDLSYLKASVETNDKRHKRLNNAIFCAVPIAAGLGAAVLQKNPVKLFGAGKALAGKSAKLARGIQTAGAWALALGAVDLMSGAYRKLVNKSDKAKKFEANNPVLSMVALVGAAYAGLKYGGKGISALSTKLTKLANQAPGTLTKNSLKVSNLLNKFDEMAIKLGDKFNKSKFVDVVSASGQKLKAKTPDALKGAGRFALDNAPLALLLGGVFHSFNHAAARNQQVARNYSELKEQQMQCAKARIADVKAESVANREVARNAAASINDADLKGAYNDMIAQINA